MSYSSFDNHDNEDKENHTKIVMSDVLSFGELIPDLWSSQDFASRTVIHLINPDISFYIIQTIK